MPGQSVVQSFAQGLLHSLRTHARGKLFLANLADDLASSRVSAPDIRAFLDTLITSVERQRDNLGNHDPLELVTLELASRGFLLRGPKAAAPVSSWCSVIAFNYATCRRYFDLGRVGGIPQGYALDELWRYIERRGDPSRFFRATAELRGRKEIAWLAPTSEVVAAFSAVSLDQRATRARDFLGLSHFSDDQFLIFFQFPPSRVSVSDPRRPLTFDAGPNLIFRTSRDRKRHGRSVDLKGTVAGAKEVIVNPIGLASDVQASAIGFVSKRTACNYARLYGKRFAARTRICYRLIEQHLTLVANI